MDRFKKMLFNFNLRRYRLGAAQASHGTDVHVARLRRRGWGFFIVVYEGLKRNTQSHEGLQRNAQSHEGFQLDTQSHGSVSHGQCVTRYAADAAEGRRNKNQSVHRIHHIIIRW